LKASDKMIRRLVEKDRKKVLNYLNQEASLNIFIIGDIENFGFDSDFQTIYGEFNDKNEYISVLLFYRINLVYYSHLNHFSEEYKVILNSHKFSYANACERLAKILYPYLNNYSYKEMYFAEAKSFKIKENISSFNFNVLQTKEEAVQLYNMLLTLDEFNTGKQSVTDFVDGKMKSLTSGITLFVEEDGLIISSAATVAETTTSAMVVAVGTRIPNRNKGLASKLVSALMEEYFNKKKYLCLFYDNPKAGKIYQRLGFENIDKWVMMEQKSE